MTEPLRNHGDHGGATAVYAVQAPQWHRASGVTGVEGPRFFFTIFSDDTAINDGTTAEPRRSWRCHGGLCRTSTAVVPCLRCDGGIIDGRLVQTKNIKLQNLNWEEVYADNDPCTAYDTFLNILESQVKECLPLKKITIKANKSDWLSKGILISCRQKNVLFKTFKQNPTI